MNQEQVKKKLLALDGSVPDFTVTFTGKKSKKVDGLYDPGKREILVHNHNFEGDNALIYTAIHEFAHHIQYTRAPVPVSSRVHDNRFWDILHRLLIQAESKGIYAGIFDRDPRFLALTKRIRDDFLAVNGHLMKEFGKLLSEAEALCRETQACFDDYVDRELRLHHAAAKAIMRVHARDVNPKIGFENMKAVASIMDPERRRAAEQALLGGDSPDMVRAEFLSRPRPDGMLENLEAEKSRIEKTLDTLTAKLAEIERRIREIREKI